MTSSSESKFKRNYQTHLKHLKLKGLQPKTIDAYARAIRRIGAYFDYQIDDLSEQQLTDYFSDLLDSHSWSAVKLDLYGLQGKFVLRPLTHSRGRKCFPTSAGSQRLTARCDGVASSSAPHWTRLWI